MMEDFEKNKLSFCLLPYPFPFFSAFFSLSSLLIFLSLTFILLPTMYNKLPLNLIYNDE